MKKKVLMLIPDGVGYKIFKVLNNLESNNDLMLTYWSCIKDEVNNNTIPLENRAINSKISILTKKYTQDKVKSYAKKFNDSDFLLYSNQSKNVDLKDYFKSVYAKLLSLTTNDLMNTINEEVRRTSYYKSSLQNLKSENPDLLFVSNQRSVYSIAPVLAAKDLGIKTATFIFSWDNLPKGITLIETDYYFVWSEYMKQEMLRYYSVKEDQIRVVGTPQFNNHYDEKRSLTYAGFVTKYNLPKSKTFVTYSGDDIRTSPNDPIYLADLAKAVVDLNVKGSNFHILFRRCPVDQSNRFDTVIADYSSVITVLDPIVTNRELGWDASFQGEDDLTLQTNILKHSIGVFNLGSSMVFDAIANNKPCGYIRYDVANSLNPNWSCEKVYNYLHFRSIPHKDAVFWVDSPLAYQQIILDMMNNQQTVLAHARKWFEIVVQQPAGESYSRIMDSLNEIVTK